MNLSAQDCPRLILPRSPSVVPQKYPNQSKRSYTFNNMPFNFNYARKSAPDHASRSFSPTKQADAVLRSLEASQRPSEGTMSSMEVSRARHTPFHPESSPPASKTVGKILENLWARNRGLFLVLFSQFFGALMDAATRLLEVEGDGMHPLQIVFARMGITMTFCCVWMWWRSVPGFPFGENGVRWLLVGRGIFGFLGTYGLYCKSNFYFGKTPY